MGRCRCEGSCFFPIFVGIIAGILASIFHFINIPFAIISLVASIVFLVLLLGIIFVVIRNEEGCCCICRHGKCLLVGTIGTFITSVITLTVGLLCGLLGTILAFLTVGFFFWMVVALWLLIKCIINELCN